MICSLRDLRDKIVINIKDCANLGKIDDIEFDSTECKLISLVIFGRRRFFGLFGREEDLVIHWKDVEMIGEDSILISLDEQIAGRLRKKNRSELFFRT